MRSRLSTLAKIAIERTQRGALCEVEVYEPQGDSTRSCFKDFFRPDEREEFHALLDRVLEMSTVECEASRDSEIPPPIDPPPPEPEPLPKPVPDRIVQPKRIRVRRSGRDLQ